MLGPIAVVAGLSATAQVPSKPAPCAATGAKTVKPCPAPDHTPTVSEQFPFPGEAPEPEPKPAVPDAPATDGPGASAGAGTASKPVKDQFPYPGETKDAPAAGDPGSSSSSSSSSSASDAGSSSPGDAPAPPDSKRGLKDEGTAGDTARTRRRRLRPQAQKVLSDDERVDEDLTVAHFYQQSGNLMGSYLRTRDAVKTEPKEPDAHLALAQAAERLGKREEAIAEYKSYLELDPDGDGVKDASKALKKLTH